MDFLDGDLHPVGAAAKDGVEISEVETAPIDGIDDSLQVTRTCELPLPFPEWAFFSGDEISALRDMSDEEFQKATEDLYRATEAIKAHLKSGAMDEAMKAFSERNKELDQAFFREAGTTEAHLRTTLGKAIADPKRSFKDVPQGSAQLEVAPGGRLARLIGASSRQPILAFVDDQQTGTESYDLLFRRQGDAWTITR